MATALIHSVLEFLSFSWVTGPIFGKELRVSSRRRRNYCLRSFYLLFLGVFLALVWVEEIRYRGTYNASYTISRMAMMGRSIIMLIVWFQFCAAQLVAGISLSTAISDEIYNRTLGVLMTTPITSFQIVTGKLLSKLLQVIILLAIAFPLLAVMRVFGGVPWDYLLSGLCVTLTTVIFVGSVSMFFSIFNRRAYIVIILTVLTLGVVFFVMPMMASFLWKIISGRWPGNRLMLAILYSNPYFVMALISEEMVRPGSTGPMAGLSWPLHCAIVLGASFVLLFLCVCMVRKAALAQVSGQTFRLFGRRRRGKHTRPARPCPNPYLAIRRVSDNPVLWKEKLLPMFGRTRVISRVFVGLGFLLLAITYLPLAMEGALDYDEVQICYCVILFGVGGLFTLILPAAAITSEKESRSWSLLLATTLSDHDILRGKFVGALRRTIGAWSPLFAHLILFTFVGFIHSVVILQIAILVAGILVFLCGSGLFFSAWFKRTTTAVIMNFAFAAVIWGVVPLLMGLYVGVTRSSTDFLEHILDMNPFVQIVVVIASAADGSMDNYDWVGFRSLNAAQSTVWMFVCMLIYSGFGLFFAQMARRMFRRRVFHSE